MPLRLTKSELAAQFSSVGFRPNPLRGQCFLVDMNMLEAMVGAAWLGPSDVVLEVGFGPGNLTARLAALAGLVVGVEIEPLLFRLARENLEFLGNVRLILGDVMESKYQLNPLLEKELLRALEETGIKDFKVVSNLPYGVATPTIMALLQWQPLGRRTLTPSLMIVSVQKEVADRLTAPPGVKEYGPVTIAAQAVSRIRRLRKMPPDVFWPRPQVESALVEIVPDEALRSRVADMGLLQRLVNALFEQRRKTLLNSLKASMEFAGQWELVMDVVEKCGIDPSLRGEALSVEEYIAVSNALAKVLSRGKS